MAAALTTTKLTGYPGFNQLKDQAVAQQAKQLWDAVHSLSSDLARAAVLINEMQGQITDLQARLTAAEARLTSGGL
jgi:hypothetical protein